MPTPRGWAALGAGLALLVLWWALGERLLLGGAAFLVLAVAVGTLYVRRRDPRASLERSIVPSQLHVGDKAIVALTLRTDRRTYHATLSDAVEALGVARFHADRIDGGVPMVARYEVLCRPRGVYRVGPASLSTGDPLGFAEATARIGGVDRLVVFPAVDRLAGLPLGRGQDPTTNVAKASFSQTSGEDFFTLREYRHGDDLRRVHWPSSARKDELMIRQLEMPWRSRALLLLDPRNDRYRDADAFEHAVRGTASALRHLHAGGHGPRLWTGGSGATAVATGTAYAVAMEELATIHPTRGMDLTAAVGRLQRSGMSGGILILATGRIDEDVVGVFRTIGRDFHRMVVMTTSESPTEEEHRLERAGAVIVRATPPTPWTEPWRNAMERAWSTATAG